MFFHSLSGMSKQKMYWQLCRARQIDKFYAVKQFSKTRRLSLLLSAAPLFIVLPALADGDGGSNSQVIIGAGAVITVTGDMSATGNITGGAGGNGGGVPDLTDLGAGGIGGNGGSGVLIKPTAST
jgi:hypothetical protein